MEVEELLKLKREQLNQSISTGVEKVIVLIEFKSGKTTWKEGQEILPPLPPEIVREIRLETDNVKPIYKPE
jgi:hypothetical protein